MQCDSFLDTFINLNIHITIHGDKNSNNYGRSVNLIDVLIAAVAIENNSKLVTRDESYMDIKGREFEFY